MEKDKSLNLYADFQSNDSNNKVKSQILML